MEWYIISTDHVLIALLTHHLDEIAIKYIGYYNHLLDMNQSDYIDKVSSDVKIFDKDLFLFCVRHGNKTFL